MEKRTVSAPLPRLLYVGDVPIEASYQSSIQLHRLLETYANDVCIVETRDPASRSDRRLPGARYHALPLSTRTAMRSGGAMHRLWLTATAAQRAADARQLAADFDAEAVLTIGSGFGWLVAAEIAAQIDVPLHVIAHDDWPKTQDLFAAWSRSRFARVYRRAQTRFCVSPFMLEEFERRYGVAGTLLYPLQSAGADARVTDAQPIADDAPIVIGFCGGSGPHVMPGLRCLARAVTGIRARVVVFGPFDDAKQTGLTALSPAFEFRGFVDHAVMMNALRGCDLLFAPMTFDAGARDNMAVSFPSKLADYTAAGVPILVHAPSYSSAARWAALHDDAAALVTADDPAALREAIVALRGDPPRRQRLAEGARRAGDRCFSLAAGRAIFEGALR